LPEEFVMRNQIVLLALVAGLSTLLATAQSAPNGAQASPAITPAKAAMTAKKPIPAPTGPLKVIYGDKTIEFTFAELAALPHKTAAVVGEHSASPENFSGVLLIDLLARVGAPIKTHGAGPRSYVVVEATDGYKAVYSLAEVNPAFRDAPVLLADAKEGKPLPAVLQIIVAGEKDGSRWIRGVTTIRVVTVD
jgi:hypothetical protein